MNYKVRGDEVFIIHISNDDHVASMWFNTSPESHDLGFEHLNYR
jgi:hypothetical protein